jgi:hypothetical protein
MQNSYLTVPTNSIVDPNKLYTGTGTDPDYGFILITNPDPAHF